MRYFLVSYAFNNGNGECTITTEGNCFINRKKSVDGIMEGVIKDGYKTEPVTILNIYEFKSKSDFDDYNHVIKAELTT